MAVAIGKECPNLSCKTFVPLRVGGNDATPFDLDANCWTFLCPSCGTQFSVALNQITISPLQEAEQ